MQTQTVNFNGTKLIAIVDENGTPWVAVKPIIDAIGLHADSAVLGIKNDEILGGVHAVYHVQDSQNKLNNMVCLPIHHVHGWLFKIETAKVKPECKEPLLMFKRECFTALYEYFMGSSIKVVENSKRRFEILKEIDKLKTQKYGIEQRLKELNAELVNIDTDTFSQLNLFKAPNQIELVGE